MISTERKLILLLEQRGGLVLRQNYFPAACSSLNFYAVARWSHGANAARKDFITTGELSVVQKRTECSRKENRAS